MAVGFFVGARVVGLTVVGRCVVGCSVGLLVDVLGERLVVGKRLVGLIDDNSRTIPSCQKLSGEMSSRQASA